MADKYADKARGGTSRSCRRRDGYPKRVFFTEEQAQEAVTRGSFDGKSLRYYLCPECTYYHTATLRTFDSPPSV